MNALWQIILWILWRRRPAMAVEANLVAIIEKGFAFFACDDAIFGLETDPAFRAKTSAALLDAHRKVDLLIYLRALEIAGLPYHGPSFRACRHPHHGDRTPQDLWRRFRRLLLRFEDAERVAHLRAAKLRREHDTSIPACLLAAAPFQPDHDDLAIITNSGTSLEVLPRLWRGRWIARACAQDGGGCAFARGPPRIPRDCPLPSADCLGSPASGTASSCPKHPALPRVPPRLDCSSTIRLCLLQRGP